MKRDCFVLRPWYLTLAKVPLPAVWNYEETIKIELLQVKVFD